MTTEQVKSKKNNYPKEKYYSCYSPRVLTHLLKNGFNPYATFVNIKTLKTCYIFEKCESVNNCIAEVSNLN